MELIYCHEHGYAWDKDVSKTVSYDQEYFDKYVNYEKTKLGEVLTKFRVNYVKEYVDQVLDIGIGSGQFVKAFNHVGKAKGYDVNPVAEKWLVDEDLWLNPYQDEQTYPGVSFWDVLEHIPDPPKLLNIFSINTYIFISIPIFDDIKNITKSKHFRPKEHLIYFEKRGLIYYLEKLGWKLIKDTDFETTAGRESIHTFVFKKYV